MKSFIFILTLSITISIFSDADYNIGPGYGPIDNPEENYEIQSHRPPEEDLNGGKVQNKYDKTGQYWSYFKDKDGHVWAINESGQIAPVHPPKKRP